MSTADFWSVHDRSGITQSESHRRTTGRSTAAGCRHLTHRGHGTVLDDCVEESQQKADSTHQPSGPGARVPRLKKALSVDFRQALGPGPTHSRLERCSRRRLGSLLCCRRYCWRACRCHPPASPPFLK